MNTCHTLELPLGISTLHTASFFGVSGRFTTLLDMAHRSFSEGRPQRMQSTTHGATSADRPWCLYRRIVIPVNSKILTLRQ